MNGIGSSSPLHMDYNGWIVGLSLLIAALAAYASLVSVSQIFRSEGKMRAAWLAAGSFVMGCGVWAMHFIGMLAMHIGTPIRYDAALTLLSGAASISASYIAFWVTVRERMSGWRLGLGGFCMATGIVIMHYTGMAAIRTDATVTYRPLLVLLSVGIAFVASFAALGLFRRFRFVQEHSNGKLFSAVLMGVAVCGMHYSGMLATSFHFNGAGSPYNPHSMEPATSSLYLVAAVAVVVFLIIGTLYGAILFDRRVLQRMTYQDALTGLPNRSSVVRYFQSWQAFGTAGAVLMIDVDRFKTVNDTLGHAFGDQLLQMVSARLAETVAGEPDKQLFRLGGDEFLLALPGVTREQAEMLGAELLLAFRPPFGVHSQVLYLTCSIGISFAPDHGKDGSSLMKATDTALYEAKAAGKNRFVVYNPRMEEEQLRRLGLERDLRRAYREKEFYVVYQPKWDSVSDTLFGMEALLRWKHPELGIISPAEFIPIAEETGLIIPITEWVLEEVCRQNKVWWDSGAATVTVSVNMSMRMFERHNLEQIIAYQLEQTGLPPSSLEIEITESIAMNRSMDVVGQLQRIRRLGVQVSMDDFGTGYSSLGSLDEMPVDTLKIDQIFIRKSQSSSKQAIISSIIAIAANLQLEVVAEGVETEEQMEFLKEKGCRLIQGYYYGKPMPTGELGAWLEARKRSKEA